MIASPGALVTAFPGGPEFALAVGQLAGEQFLEGFTEFLVRIVGLTLVAGVATVLAAVLYRWYARVRIPEGLGVLIGLAVVAIYLNTDVALSQVIGGGTGLLDPVPAARNVVTFLLAGAASLAGRRVGDRIALDIGAVSGSRELDVELSRLVRSVGRSIHVEMPESIDDVEDIEGYDPVSPETKAAVAGKTLVFPRGLTVSELRERLADRLRADYGVGHVDVDLAADGSVEFLAVGSRASGIGPTLVPGTAATAVRADPPFAATSGDAVQVWAAGQEPERVASGEVRGTAGDVVTLAVDEVDAEALSPDRRYRLVTLPGGPRADREFASLLRRADETMSVVTVAEGSAIAGETVGDLDVTLVAVHPADGPVETIPRRGRPLAVGDDLYVIARPEAIRRLEASAGAVDAAAPDTD